MATEQQIDARNLAGHHIGKRVRIDGGPDTERPSERIIGVLTRVEHEASGTTLSVFALEVEREVDFELDGTSSLPRVFIYP